MGDDTAARIAPGPPLSADPPSIVRSPLQLGLIAALLAGLAGLADLAWAGMAAPAFEELLNVRAALLVACGHADALADLQYRSFCGGCSADALLGAAPMRLLGASVGSWKVVPLGLHAVAVGSLVGIAAVAGGRRSGLVVLGLLLAAPAAWRELVLTGWGNHAESAAFTFGAAALLIGARRRAWGAGLAGVVAGLGLWYAWISAHALPALAVGALLAGGPRALLAFGVGLPLGAAPLGLFLIARPAALPETGGLWAHIDLASPTAWLRWWTEPLLPGRSWPHGDGALRWLGAAATVGLGLLGVAGTSRIIEGRRAPAGVAAAVVALGLAGMGLATLLRHDLWVDNATLMGFDPFALRYRAPALPLLVLGAGLAAGRSRGAAGVGLLIAAFGLQQRVAGWVMGPGQDLSRPLEVVALAADLTVPEGAPPRRNPGRMGRPQDVAAAERLLATHTDPLPVCRAVHAAELGRRMGLRDAHQGCPAPDVAGVDSASIHAGFQQACLQ
jgi:hypothetical protein